jgi:hypothetical protein
MSIFNRIFHKPERKPNTLLVMVLLPHDMSFSLKRLIQDYHQHYDEFIEPDGDDIASVFTLKGEQIGLMNINNPVPADDIEGTARYAYNWNSAREDLKDHTAHVVIAIMDGSHDEVKRFKLQTQLLCSVLRTTDAIGVYNGEQLLLIPKDKYLRDARNLQSAALPVNLWVYFGLQVIDGKSNGYTYGLEAFGKDEIEVLDSDEKIDDLLEMLINITEYVLLKDVTFKPGQTVGYTKQQQIMVSYSKGSFVEGNSFKLFY